MTDTDRTDEFIRNAASDYNRPPATPLDEMWAAIQAAKSAPRPRLHVTAGGAAPLGGYSTSTRHAPKYTWLGFAAAAALLVATGVGIGRWTSSPGEPARQVADAPSLTTPVVTSGGIVAPGGRDSAPSEAIAGESAVPQPSGAEPNGAQRPGTTRTREDIRRNPVVIGTGGVRRVVTSGVGRQTPGIGSQVPGNGLLASVSYQVATEETLEDAEALLTSFAVESRDERMNAQFSGWAKGILSNTRLLLDSPAGDDPRRARLLQDLELVLAQIVQLSPNAPATERELIEGSMQNRNVLTRLRTAIPAAR